jgi:phospholipase C
MSLQAFAGRVELFTWMDELEALKSSAKLTTGGMLFTGNWLGQQIERLIPGEPRLAPDQLVSGLLDDVIHVVANASNWTDIAPSVLRDKVRKTTYDHLRSADPFTGRRPRDDVSRAVTSFLLGDVPATEFTNGTHLQDLRFEGGDIVISYMGPQAWEPPMPSDWPASFKRDIGNLSQIDHLVVLTMENRSFDHMLGYLDLPVAAGGAGRDDVDGLTSAKPNLLDDEPVEPFPFAAGDTVFSPDPPHGYEPVAMALDVQNGVPSMDGFVRAMLDERGRTVAPRIMGHQTAENVPTYDALARDFGIGHRWFAAHPGPTFCNRHYELTGHLNLDPDGFFELDNGAAGLMSSVPTIFDHLTAAGVSWRYFEHEYCFLRLFERYTFDDTDVVPFDDPARGFAALAAQGALPSVTFIDPHFIELPPDANCDGPPADIRAGQELVRRVVERVVASPLWERTLLVIVYDEHGGFYDHVAPPAAPPVTPDSPATYGVRVPAFAISPWVAARSVFGDDGLRFDHTSLLATIVRRFLPDDPPAMGARYAAAEDVSHALAPTRRAVTGNLRPFLPYWIAWAAGGGALSPGAAVAPGGALSLGPEPGPGAPDPKDTRAFCLEDRPDGTFRIRSRVGRLYLTAQPDGRVVLDVDQPAEGRQVWALEPATPAISAPYVVSCPALPGLVLRLGADPADPSAVGLGAGSGAWWITSPLLPPPGTHL